MTVSFRTYRDAHASLGIPGSHMVGTQGTASTGVRSLKLTCHDDSRDELLDGGARIMCGTRYSLHTECTCNMLCMYVGRGVKPSPANPVADQMLADQELFRTSIKTCKRHVLVLTPLFFQLMQTLQAPPSLCCGSMLKGT
jgi:hypothetical protein